MRKRVSLFVTCIVDQIFPEIGLATADVLERLGYSIDFPEDQTCCGQPAFNTGYRRQARKVACRCLDACKDAECIVVPSGSCTSMMVNHFEELFADEPKILEETRQLKPRIWEFSRFLLEVAQVEDVGARYEGIVTFHDSCHGLRELNIKEGPRRLLSHVKGLTIREMDASEECCGFGGTFSVKFVSLSLAMLHSKLESIKKTGADTVVAIDASCLLHIRAGSSRTGYPIKTMHLAQILASR